MGRLIDLVGSGSSVSGSISNIITSQVDPTINENLPKGTIWVNEVSGEIFVCVDDTTDENIWQGQLGTKIIPFTTNIVDSFGDGSGIALYQLDGNANDTGGMYNGTPNNITYSNGKFGQAVVSINGSSQITIPLNYNKDVITISFWGKWNGVNGVMPIGFHSYSLWLYGNDFGFNTMNSDLFGITNPFNTTDFVHIVAEFHEGDYTLNKLWVNGVKQTLTQKRNSQITSNVIIKNTDFHIFGRGYDASYGNFGSVDQVRIFNRALTDSEVQRLYNEK